jgi:2-phospho-L-lactate guanylyltransferase
MSTARFWHPEGPWHLIIPVKDTRHGKTRLLGLDGLVTMGRSELSRAIADDTLAAAVETVGPDLVWLVTPDPALRRDWSSEGVHLVDDPGMGLNAAIRAGFRSVPAGSRHAALLGDLPALRAADLRTALEAAADQDESFVPDAAGTGTVLRCGRAVVPRFGPGSAAAHAADGATRLELDLPRLRCDVDDPESLEAATRLGVGPATARVLGRGRAG